MSSGLPAPFTIEPCDGPVLPHCRWHTWQLEDEGPHVGIDVGVGGRDVDDIQVWLLADLRLLWQQLRSIVIDVDQVDLQSARATGRGNSCMGDKELSLPPGEWWDCQHHGPAPSLPSSSNKPGFPP